MSDRCKAHLRLLDDSESNSNSFIRDKEQSVSRVFLLKAEGFAEGFEAQEDFKCLMVLLGFDRRGHKDNEDYQAEMEFPMTSYINRSVELRERVAKVQVFT